MEQLPTPPSDQNSSPNPARHTTSWIGGIVLILIGVAFLFNQTGVFQINNWWAFFILIPAIGSFIIAYSTFQKDGKLGRKGLDAIIAGLFLVVLTTLFVFSLDIGNLWPLFVIFLGIVIILRGTIS